MRKALFALCIGLATSLSVSNPVIAETLILGVDEATLAIDPQTGLPALQIRLSPESTKAFGDLTIRHISSVVELSLDGKVLTTPRIQSAITAGSLHITGVFSNDEVRAMVVRLDAGAPLKVRVVDD
ncbi:SecDF P1 head subdomain-containing protein [Pelagibacterium sp.]|uniref:SecDF P1 head subdomain-containing protein n=1 Tax=Pelagibacterium sp. TaxID=1967288 RepID=UPI003A9110C4